MPKHPAVSDDDDSESISSNSEESSGEHEDNYENDGFVVPDEDVDEPAPEEERPKPKKHKSGRIKKMPKPDPEDLELAGIRPLRANTMGDLEQQLFAEDDRTQLESTRRETHTEDVELDESEKDDAFFVNDEPSSVPLSYGLEKYTPKEPEAPKAVFEPSDIIGRFGLPEDEIVRTTDLPERLQRNLKGRLDPSDEELDKETNWLLLKLVSGKSQFIADEVKSKIRHFLQLYRVDKFETAFIQTYRLNLLSPELTEEDLWDLTRLDIEWGYIFEQKQKTKEVLLEALANTHSIATGGSAVPGKRMLLGAGDKLPRDVEELLEQTSDGNYYFELEDLAKFVETYLTPVESGEGFRRSSTRNRILTEGRRFRLHEFAARAGLSPFELSQNIENNARLNPIPKNSVKPQELAFDYLCDEYKTEAKVLKSLSDYMRTELTGDPTFRSYVRAKYGYYVRVYTSPTEKGKEVLDIFHPFYRTKSLGRLSSSEGEPKEGKDIDSFGKTDLWLEVSKCESDSLIKVDFVLPWSDPKDDKIVNEVKQFYLSGEAVDEVEADWNEFRGEVLRQALAEMYVALQGEYRRYLTTKAEENVLAKCREEYRKRLLQPPYIVHDEESSSPKVFSLVLDPSSPKFGITALVVLDSSGQVLDSTTLAAFLKWEKEVLQPTDRERHSNDVKTFQRMLLTYRPEVIVLSANCLQCVLLRRTVVLECRVMTRDGYEKPKVDWNVDPSALLEKMPDVVMGSTEIPRLFADSHRGKRMLSDLSPLLRQAVSLGRQLQNPAAELLGLWQDPSENLTPRVNLHILQRYLSEKQLLNALEEAAVQVCSHIGADINSMLDNPHLRAPLSFVPGLGLIKAHFLFENLMRVGHIPVRMELLQNRLIEPRVFENCVGFVIVQGTDRSDPLDRTRIHPAHYEIAQTIAASALDSKDEKDERNIERVMKNPERLDKVELDFDAYASHLATKGRLKMREIIDMVVREMKSPFAVQWDEFHDMEPLTVLYQASGETEYTLRRGVVVHAVVSSVVEDKPMRCRLESGLDASARGVGPDLKEGTTIRGRVTKVIAECKMPESLFFQIQLACTPDDLSNHMAYRMDILRLAELDPAFAENPLDWKEVQLVEEETKNGQKYIPRLINHPKFRNIGLNTAVSELERKDIGECIFRPSSRGQDHITCTFKFYDFVCSHLDIVEEGKPADNMLGSRFKIGEEGYESLQEIIERYVVPVSTLTKDAITHKKFLDLTGRGSEQIEAIIRQEKQASPNNIPYYFTILPAYPQFFVLFYLPKQHVVKEYIKVKPKGLFFHERFHSNMNYLIAWFKKHYSEQTYQSLLKRSVAPKVISDNIFAIPSKKTERPMTPRRTDDRYENAGRSSPAYSSRTDQDRPRHTPRHEIEAADDPWKTPQQSDPWKQSPWSSSRTPAEEEVPPPRPSRSQLEESEDFGDRRGGRGNRRGGVRGGRGCYICQEEGHISRNCPKASREMNCYNCQKPGHMAKDCPEEPRPRGDRRSSRHGREDARDEESHADSWGGSNWEATPRSQGWGPSDKMHVDENKWE